MFKLQNLVSAILNVLSGTKNDIRDKKTISGTKNDIRDRKRYQSDISFLCPPIINLIKAQVCDKYIYIYLSSNSKNICRGIFEFKKFINNSRGKYKRNECLINVCKSDKDLS